MKKTGGGWKACLFLASLLLVLGGGAVLLVCQVSFHTGPCVIADNDACLLVMDGGPVELSRQGKDFSTGLETGDTILAVLRGGIAESYPGEAGAIAVVRLRRGSIVDVPSKVLLELEDMGWWSPPN